MNLNLLDNLKNQLVNSKTLGPIYTYFLDHFGESREFMALGGRVRHAMLESIYSQVLQQQFKKEIDITSLILTEIPGHQFIHGAAMFHGNIASVIYFEDVQAGLIVVASPLTSIETKFIRFSLKGLRGVGEPSLN